MSAIRPRALEPVIVDPHSDEHMRFLRAQFDASLRKLAEIASDFVERVSPLLEQIEASRRRGELRRDIMRTCAGNRRRQQRRRT